MEGPNKNSNARIESENKMTPQKLLEEIKKAYPTSHAFLQQILEAGNNNWGMGQDPTVQNVIIQLAQQHRTIKSGQYTFDIQDPEEKEKKMYERGLWLGSMATAVYHGELTMVDKDGALLTKPEVFQKG
jgi:hypothetical protein